MALRHRRGAGLRRAAPGRAGFVALACALYLAAGFAATWPAVLHAGGSHFLAGGAPGHGEAAPGDHLQSVYRLWLVGDQIEHGRAPWRDPYTFRPEAGPVPNFPGWPYGFAYWPLDAALGHVSAWNVLTLLLYVAAGLAACAWLRELDLPRGSALAGGLAFALAPYRVSQSVGHLLGPISVLLPVALWAFERALTWSRMWLVLSALALASIPLSGQVHLALGAIPFFCLYALCRTRSRRTLAGAGGAALTGVGAGILVQRTVIAGSIGAHGRSLDQVTQYSARWGDFVARHVDHARSEQFVFLGWATPLLAVVGLVVLVQAGRRGLAAALGLGALVPIVVALGTHVPLYSWLWHTLPPFRFPRVPERLLPIACLCLAGLVGFALASVRRRAAAVSALALLLLFVDLHVRIYGQSVADHDNGAYAALRTEPPGRLLELPVFLPDVHYGSVYLWYDTTAARERPLGYSTTAPKRVRPLAERLERLNCGDWSGGAAGSLRALGVRYLTLHRGLFTHNRAVPDTYWLAWRSLVSHGWTPLPPVGGVTLFTRARAALLPLPGPEPAHRPTFCQGWFGERSPGAGREMSETHAPFWVYGGGTVRLRLAAAESATPIRFEVDERPTQPVGVSRASEAILPLGRAGWHLVAIDVPRLVERDGRKVGARLLGLRVGP